MKTRKLAKLSTTYSALRAGNLIFLWASLSSFHDLDSDRQTEEPTPDPRRIFRRSGWTRDFAAMTRRPHAGPKKSFLAVSQLAAELANSQVRGRNIAGKWRDPRSMLPTTLSSQVVLCAEKLNRSLPIMFSEGWQSIHSSSALYRLCLASPCGRP
jgi:hypothetical protein